MEDVGDDLRRFVDSMIAPVSDGVTEVIGTDAGTDHRSAEYQMVFDSASSKVLVSGVGMANVRNALPLISQRLLDGAAWSVTFLVPNHEFLRRNSQLTSQMYRPSIDQEIVMFCNAVEAEHRRLGDRKQHLSVWSFEGMMTFSATVADIGAVGSLMAVEAVLPVSGEHYMARPRLLLRRRVEHGLYDRYARALAYYLERSRRVL